MGKDTIWFIFSIFIQSLYITISSKYLGIRLSFMIPLVHVSKEVEESKYILKYTVKVESSGKLFIKVRTDKDGYFFASLIYDKGYSEIIPLNKGKIIEKDQITIIELLVEAGTKINFWWKSSDPVLKLRPEITKIKFSVYFSVCH